MQNYPFIPFVPDLKTVMRRMGSQKAVFPEALKRDIDSYYKKAQSAFRAAGRSAIVSIAHISQDEIVVGGRPVKSAQLKRLLKNSSSACLMCTTIRQRDVDKIGEAMSNEQGLLALVLDAYASEYVDGALDVIMDQKNMMMRQTGTRLTKRRFSAGYGDLDIQYQKVFYDLLGMQTLNVQINDKFLLSPEKSVIAIAGVVAYEED